MSTNIDGSLIVILSEEEARCVYNCMAHSTLLLSKTERKITRKIEKAIENLDLCAVQQCALARNKHKQPYRQSHDF